jgi:hypothetical protein
MAVNVTDSPTAKFAEQSEPPEPQFIPGPVILPLVGLGEIERL